MNYTGCGNSVNLTNTPVIRLVLDSLRYWVQEMHVDGFRFDLASVLGREDGSFQRSSAFFDSVSQDPLLSRVKLIAEPWDLGTYQVGNFPAEWAEWNGRFRDTVRRFVKGDSGQLRELGFRLTGSSDLYGDDGRSAYNSVNFVTCHDGFTQYDLVAYNGKHNEANGENNNDGSNDNASWNCGAEGETGDEGINEIRMRQMKNFAAILLLSAGTPMILAGDEFANTQGGNNNAYCQDNAISWLDWSRAAKYAGLREFYRKLIAFRLRHAVFTRKNFYTGRDTNGNHIADLSWFGPELDAPYWDVPEARYCGMLLDATESGDDCLFGIFGL
jgi:isoamylase